MKSPLPSLRPLSLPLSFSLCMCVPRTAWVYVKSHKVNKNKQKLKTWCLCNNFCITENSEILIYIYSQKLRQRKIR